MHNEKKADLLPGVILSRSGEESRFLHYVQDKPSADLRMTLEKNRSC